MNTPAFPPVATGGRSVLDSLSTSRFPASRAAIIGAGCILAVAIVAIGALLPDDGRPDPTQTAAVPVQPTIAETGAVAVAAAPVSTSTATDAAPGFTPTGAGDTVATQQARQPSPVMRQTEVLPATTSRFEAKASTGPDERTSAGTGLGTFVPTATPAPTAAIAEGLRGSIDVQVAESEAEVAMLETSTGMIDPLNSPLPELRPAKAAKYANLRDGPADESNVLLVVPANAAIEAETGCDWCTVVYNGQRGFMYKSLIRRSAAEEAAAGEGLF